jgi:hypothetical protein
MSFVRSVSFGWIVAGVVSLCASRGAAQWTVTNLHPAGSLESQGFGGQGGQQVGRSSETANGAALWTGTAASEVDLNPAGATQSRALSVDVGMQVGWAELAGVKQAGRWAGTAGSWTSLHPGGAISSEVRDVHAGLQVGWAMVQPVFETHAGLWHGSSGSWQDIHPHPSWAGSYAYGVSSSQIVGAVITTLFSSHACIWRVSDLQWTDIAPMGLLESVAYATDGSLQVGSTYLPGPSGTLHASLWAGTAASWVDMHPAGAFDSEALDLSDGQQVGWARFSGVHHAALWSGTAASFVDLHAFLPPAFTSSRAESIWNSGGKTFVAGFGFNSTSGRTEALLWTRTAALWTDLGYGLAGVSGVPSLVGAGSLVGGSPGSLVLSSAKASSPATLFVSLVNSPSPFKGGLLVTVPVLLSAGVVTNAGGGVTLPFTWPSGVPSLTSFYFQFAVQDPAGPKGAALSNALKATTP